MPKRLFDILKVLVGIALSGFLLFLVFRNVAWEEFWLKAKVTDLSWVIASIILSVFAYAARAYRWNILLEPLGYHLKTSRTTLAVLVGYLVNLAVPRLGEITRCGILKRNENVPMPQSVGSVVTERIIDLFTLLFFFSISLLVEYDRIARFLSGAYQDTDIPAYLQYLVPLLMLLGTVGIILFIRGRKSLKKKIIGLMNSFLEGMLSLRKIKRPLGFVISTLALWLAYYLMSYIIVFSLPETAHLDLRVGFMLLVTGG
ncbi:MAG: lysylphosphatidylglycerol synthase transmembrane domain-containing protein, partial [Ekhidna sp.]|nr:lysylphosphatidylglycerol synthase transmembrane domain-containing protein [Ekhidna sp.]